jgi:NAD(P)-dependent dehydrogenase (short-subunit alcohol dehydrogenase family)
VDGPGVVLTGASSGIGAAAARELHDRGATVVPVGRDPERVARIAEEVGDEGLVADFASLAGVRRLADELLERYERIDVLANNAGALFTSRRVTPDGYEQTFALNHLAPFLLTSLLIERLRESGARVVTTASDAHTSGALDLDDLQCERSFRAMRTYSTSKLCNVLFTRELAKREPDVTATCFHPGLVRTGWGKNDGLLYRLGLTAISPFMRSPERGARSLVWLALSDEAAELDGAYVQDEKVRAPSAAAQDDVLAVALWQASEELVNRRTH